MTSIDKLEPCPFCGGDEELRVCQPDHLSGYWVVHCGCCGGEMQAESKGGAIAGWNTRSLTPQAGEGVERCAKWLRDNIDRLTALNVNGVADVMIAELATLPPAGEGVVELVRQILENSLFPVFGAGPYEATAAAIVAALPPAGRVEELREAAFELCQCIDRAQAPASYDKLLALCEPIEARAALGSHNG